MKNSITKYFNADGFSIVANGKQILTVFRIPFENESKRDLLLENGKRAIEELQALENGKSKFVGAQEKFNSLK